jgi:7-cyano-7-deazaguanine synthase
MKRALVIFSGGQDSTTCLYWAMKRYDEIHAITFNYGQKHSIELECAKEICSINNIKQVIIDISFLDTIVESALTNGGDVNKLNKKGLPSSFVPNRNQIFITLAHSYLQKIGGGDLITGVCQTDYSGYPDCRREYIDAIELATNLGSDERINIITPLMFLDKAETFKFASDEGFLNEIVNLSHTCYNGVRDNIFEWGAGCGECPACQLRAEGWRKYKELYD